MKPEQIQTDLDRRIITIREHMKNGVLRYEDVDWLLTTIETMDHSLQTVYWMIHGSETGQSWSGRKVTEKVIQRAYGEIHA